MAITSTVSISTNTNIYTLGVKPEYALYVGRWGLQQEVYEGSGGFIDGTRLVKHPRETDAGFTARKDICWFPNYPRSLFDTLKGYLYKEPVVRSTDNDDIDAFHKKTDKNGRMTIDELMRKADRYADIYGYSFILIDKTDETFISRADEVDGGLPYAYVLKPEQVIDWYKNDNDEYVWIKIKEIHTEDAEDPNGSHDEILKIRVWTQTETWLENHEGVRESDVIVHNLGIVPIVQLKSQDSLIYPDIGTTFFSTLSQIALRLFNLLSQKDSLLGNQTFAILYYQSDTDLTQPAATDDTTDAKNAATLNDSSMLRVGTDAKLAPGFISPDGSAVEAYDKSIDMSIQMMGELVNIKNMGGIYSSGLEAKLDFEKTNQSLIASAERLSDAEKSVLDIYATWLEITDHETVVTYPTDFNLRDMDTRLKEIFDTLMLDISDRFNKEYKKQASRELLPDVTKEVQAEIDEEIDEDLPDFEGILDGETADRETSDNEGV